MRNLGNKNTKLFVVVEVIDDYSTGNFEIIAICDQKLEAIEYAVQGFYEYNPKTKQFVKYEQGLKFVREIRIHKINERIYQKETKTC